MLVFGPRAQEEVWNCAELVGGVREVRGEGGGRMGKEEELGLC